MSAAKVDLVVINDDSSTEDIEAAIKVLRAKQDRMPKHYTDRRAELGDVIDVLVDRWITRKAAESG